MRLTSRCSLLLLLRSTLFGLELQFGVHLRLLPGLLPSCLLLQGHLGLLLPHLHLHLLRLRGLGSLSLVCLLALHLFLFLLLMGLRLPRL